MILITDFGDNKEKHDMHTLYIIEEPRLSGERFGESAAVIKWPGALSFHTLIANTMPKGLPWM